MANLRPGALGGVVRDPTGASVAGAKVVLTEESKRLVYKSETDRSGAFLFPSILAGAYELHVEKDGFRGYEMDHLQAVVGETATLAITLTLGDVRTVLTVTAPDTTQLDNESNTLGTLIDSGRVHNLPLNGRHFLQLALLAGGTAEISPANTLSSANVGPPNGRSFSPEFFLNQPLIL